MTTPASLGDLSVLVLGLGRFSGGVETVRFLRNEGCEVRVSDLSTREALAASAAEAEALGATLHFGPQTPDLLDAADLVIAGPAIPFDHPVLLAAKERGLPITTEMTLFLERVRAPVLGVTGTKGKSTTATLLHAMLAATGRRAHLGGNVGRSLVASLSTIDPSDLVVLELSSFQLHWLRRARLAPHVAVITNLFGDHLDRHGSFEAYAEAKRTLLDFQGAGDVAVLPTDDPDVEAAGFGAAGAARRVRYGPGGSYRIVGDRVEGPAGPVLDLGVLRLWGTHNRRNALAAAAAAMSVPGVEPRDVARGAAEVDPLPHRLAPVAEVDGVLWVDDSNGTNPTSTLCALEASPRPAVVLVGGRSKGLDVEGLVEGLVHRAKAVVGIGTTGPDVVARIGGRLPTANAHGMEAAVRAAAGFAAPGDAVLLSPAFSSLDEYTSFVERGRAFQAAVRGLAGRGART